MTHAQEPSPIARLSAAEYGREHRPAATLGNTPRPLAETRAAHERLEAGEQLGKIILTIP